MTAPLDPYVRDLVRQQDRPRFAATMFAPAELRDLLLAVLAFNVELARIPGTVSEPMLGQMRLQWWRDLVDGLAAGRPAPTGHPVAQVLAAAMPSLTPSRLQQLIDCREPLLVGEGAARAIEAEGDALAGLYLDTLGGDDGETRAAARDAAIAYGLATLNEPGASDHAWEHIAGARARRARIDRRGIPVLLWATLAESRLRASHSPIPVGRMMWRAWRGRY